MNFGTKIKDLRIRAQMTLRNFAKRLDIDASNWSKIERGIIPPPAPETLIERITPILNLSAAESQELLDLAAISRRELPADLQENTLLLSKMPAFFRAMKDREYTEEDLDRLIGDITKINKP